MLEDKKGQFFVGKVKDFEKAKGWFFGYFMEEDKLRSNLVEIAWQDISNKKPESEDKHFHKQSVEINIVLSGAVSLKINGQKYSVSSGQFYVIYPHVTVEDIEASENTRLMVVRAPSLGDDKFLA
ncbi:MAG: cupin domain-containing protein [Candidatus Liptonbacteria bacterium]